MKIHKTNIPSLSVIIPAYNAEKTINNTLMSIINEINDNFPIEILVFNDGSTDNTKSIVEKFQEKYSFIKLFNLNNSGVSNVRNFALNQISSDYLWMIDADDIILPNTINQIFKHIIEYNSPDILSFNYIIEDKFLVKNEMICYIESKIVDGVDFLKNNDGRLYLWNNVYKKDLILNNKITFLSDIIILEDALFNIKAFINAKKVACINHFGYLYKYQNSSITKNKSLDKKILRADSSLKAHIELKRFSNLYDKFSQIHLVITAKLLHSINGFFYSLFIENYPIKVIISYYDLYKKNNLLPNISKTKSYKIRAFELLVNLKYPYFLICKIHNLVKPRLFSLILNFY